MAVVDLGGGSEISAVKNNKRINHHTYDAIYASIGQRISGGLQSKLFQKPKMKKLSVSKSYKLNLKITVLL